MKRTAILSILLLALAAESLAVERLFTTSNDRRLLDNKRYGTADPTLEQARESSQAVMLNGMVKTHGRRTSIWVNGEAADAEANYELQSNNADGGLRLRLLDRALDIDLKPGQQLDLRTGTHLESFNVAEQQAGDEQAEGEDQSREGSEADPGGDSP